jgi:hypothetical protein
VPVNGYKKAGIHIISFNGENLQSGLYIYRMETSGFAQSGKMILLK